MPPSTTTARINPQIGCIPFSGEGAGPGFTGGAAAAVTVIGSDTGGFGLGVGLVIAAGGETDNVTVFSLLVLSLSTTSFLALATALTLCEPSWAIQLKVVFSEVPAANGLTEAQAR